LECWVKKMLLVRTGYGAELERVSPAELKRAVIVNGLEEAADWIVPTRFALIGFQTGDVGRKQHEEFPFCSTRASIVLTGRRVSHWAG